MNPTGVLLIQSEYSVREATKHLEDVLHQSGITVYAHIDQQSELKKAGVDISPMEFLLFGEPSAGGPVIVQNPLVALDLPLKLLIFENDKAETWIVYNDADYIGSRYNLEKGTYLPFTLDKLIQKALAQ